MATWTGVITNVGSALLAEWVNGKVLRFDSAAAGEGTVDVVALLAQTDLVSKKQVISILGSEKVETGIRLKMRIQAAPKAYTMHQIGVWASCGDGESVMIALFQHQTGIPIPSQAESPDFSYTFYALVSCSNTGEWTVNVDPSAFVNHGDLNETINALTAQSVGAIAEKEKGKANGVATLDGSGKVPSSQLPPMDYDPKGTADNKVNFHNEDENSHPHLLKQIGTCKNDVQKAQNTADDALKAVNRITITIKTLPSQSGTITYNGASQSPAWNGYDPNTLTLGGTTSGINAGTYNATFTPKSNFKWPDGGTSERTVSWTIGKAPGSLFLSESSIALDISKVSGTIKVMRAGEGAISASSNATGVADVSVFGDVVTVAGKSKGSATITISVAADSNHTTISKTCSVSVQLPSTTLSDNDWATIHQVSSAGQGANYWAVGDMKPITINGKVGNTTFSNLSINVFILGFNHNASKEGSNRIHFQIGKIGTTPVALCDANYGSSISGSGYFNWNTSNTNNGGWKSCYKRTTLYGNSGTPTSPVSNSLIAALPADLRAVMQPVTKYTDNTGNASDTSGAVTATTDYLFDLAEFEVFGKRNWANQYEKNSQLQYDYYKAGNKKIAYKHSAVSTAVWWGLRSPYYQSGNTFLIVDTNGTYSGYYAHASGGLRPGFAA